VKIGSNYQPRRYERRASDGTYSALSVGANVRYVDHGLENWQQSLVLGDTTGHRWGWLGRFAALFGRR
jgi:hypothetical protein